MLPKILPIYMLLFADFLPWSNSSPHLPTPHNGPSNLHKQCPSHPALHPCQDISWWDCPAWLGAGRVKLLYTTFWAAITNTNSGGNGPLDAVSHSPASGFSWAMVHIAVCIHCPHVCNLAMNKFYSIQFILCCLVWNHAIIILYHICIHH